MITFRAEETIARSAADVFDLAADIERHPRWMNVLDARVVRGRSAEVGTIARERMRFGPRVFDIEFEVATAEPGRTIGWHITGGAPFDANVTLELEQLGPATTRAIYSGSLRLHGAWRLLAPLMAREAQQGEAAELRRLKEILETSATAEAGAAQPAPTES